jgi:polysaccharide chain length determinant protein (PEP-CTERM system associated)
MINPNKSFGLHNYIDIFLRRIWYIVIPFVVVLAGTILYAKITPKIYKVSTLVLVTPQKVPENFIRPTVTSTIQDRLQSISQEILSRTRLEQLISEFKLYPQLVKAVPMEQVVELMRKDVQFEIKARDQQNQGRESAGGYFTISYIGKEPTIVTQVTNKLASLFIEENLKLREQQAQGTVEFLGSELNTTKQALEEQEKKLTGFKRQHLNELPEQRDANIRVLEQLQLNHQRITEALRAAEDRKLMIQNKLADIEIQGTSSIYVSNPRDGGAPTLTTMALNPREHQLDQLKTQLAELQAKYTENHPDIVSTKKKITDFEKRINEVSLKKEKGEKAEDGRAGYAYNELKSQLIPIDLEIQRLKKDEVKVKNTMADYRARIENTPVREIAISQLLQDYTQSKEAYQTLLKKKEEAQQGENLERRQKGEQFKVIDPARFPERPFKPDIPRVLLIGLLAGLGAGLGSAFLREQLDRSFRDAEDVETTLGLRVLANIPKIETEAVA